MAKKKYFEIILSLIMIFLSNLFDTYCIQKEKQNLYTLSESINNFLAVNHGISENEIDNIERNFAIHFDILTNDNQDICTYQLCKDYHGLSLFYLNYQIKVEIKTWLYYL